MCELSDAGLDQDLSMDALAVDWACLPLYAVVFALHRRIDPKAWPGIRRVAGLKTNCLLPSLGRLWIRPRS